MAIPRNIEARLLRTFNTSYSRNLETFPVWDDIAHKWLEDNLPLAPSDERIIETLPNGMRAHFDWTIQRWRIYP